MVARTLDFEQLSEVITSIPQEWEHVYNLPNSVIVSWVESIIERLEGAMDEDERDEETTC